MRHRLDRGLPKPSHVEDARRRRAARTTSCDRERRAPARARRAGARAASSAVELGPEPVLGRRRRASRGAPSRSARRSAAATFFSRDRAGRDARRASRRPARRARRAWPRRDRRPAGRRSKWLGIDGAVMPARRQLRPGEPVDRDVAPRGVVGGPSRWARWGAARPGRGGAGAPAGPRAAPQRARGRRGLSGSEQTFSTMTTRRREARARADAVGRRVAPSSRPGTRRRRIPSPATVDTSWPSVAQRPPTWPPRPTRRRPAEPVRSRRRRGAIESQATGQGRIPARDSVALAPPAPDRRTPWPQRALITGITGQDGSYLAELLLDRGLRGDRRRASQLDAQPRADQPPPGPAHPRPGRPARTRRRSSTPARVPPARGLQPRRAELRPASWTLPVLTGETTALGVTRMLDAIRIVDPEIRFYQASSSEMFGQVVETPQTRDDAVLPAQPLRRGQGLRPLDHRQLPRELRPVRHARGSCSTTSRRDAGLEFVTRKVTDGVARIKLGLDTTLRLGNLDADARLGLRGRLRPRDVAMLQHDTPDDFVVATGETHSMRELCEVAFGAAGLRLAGPRRGRRALPPPRRGRRARRGRRQGRAACSAGGARWTSTRWSR